MDNGNGVETVGSGDTMEIQDWTLLVTLPDAQYEQLRQLAYEETRTPEQQATYMLKRSLTIETLLKQQAAKTAEEGSADA